MGEARRVGALTLETTVHQLLVDSGMHFDMRFYVWEELFPVGTLTLLCLVTYTFANVSAMPRG